MASDAAARPMLRAVEPDLEEASRDLDGADAVDVIRWASKRFGGRLAVSSSFGAQAAVMLHLVSRHAPGTPVVFVDTGYLFPETYRYAHDLTELLELDVRVYHAKLTAAHQEALYGRLWEQGEEGVHSYLQLNKVEPMKRALDELGIAAWMAGLRAGQTDHRRALRTVDVQDGRAKIHPILHWSDERVEAYVREHALPQHPLYGDGYRSIGDWHSTLPTLPDQDPREGRILGKARECGLHLTEEQNRSLTSSKL